MPKVTIRDVAEAAGVSVSAVSYILNGSTKKKYSEKTMKAVRRAAERLQYTPNSIARGMRSQKAHSVGIVNFWEMNNAVFMPSLRAVAEVAAEKGSSTVICTGCEDFSYIDLYRSRAVDGFVLIAPGAAQFNERAHTRALIEAGAPFVIVNGALRGADIPAVYCDFYSVSRTATEYLLSLGRRRIVYVDAFSAEAARELRDRREGYVDAMREAGLLPRTYDLEGLTADELFGIEAVVTARAETAHALMRRLLNDGIRIPTSFEIIAGSREALGQEEYLPLTYVDFAYREIGEFAFGVATGLSPVSALTPAPFIHRGKTVRE